jgi:hypothetical protein
VEDVVKVQINYKSGQSIIVKVEKLEVSRRGGTLDSIKWDGIAPEPLFMGIDDIESIWQLS